MDPIPLVVFSCFLSCQIRYFFHLPGSHIFSNKFSWFHLCLLLISVVSFHFSETSQDLTEYSKKKIEWMSEWPYPLHTWPWTSDLIYSWGLFYFFLGIEKIIRTGTHQRNMQQSFDKSHQEYANNDWSKPTCSSETIREGKSTSQYLHTKIFLPKKCIFERYEISPKITPP